jgi:glycosyltransferase involved in cell wall biosynthesis
MDSDGLRSNFSVRQPVRTDGERNLRVAIFLPSLEGGGAERVMCNLAYQFAECGLGVDLVLSQKTGPYLRDVPPGVGIIDLKVRRTIASIPKLVKYLRTANPYCLISALSHANITAILAHMLARSSAKLIVSEHVAPKQLQLHTESIRERLLPLLIPILYRRTDHIIAVSIGVAKQLAEFGLRSDKVAVIYNPILNDELFRAAEEDVDDPWFSPGAPPVLVAAGRLVKQKDFQTLIRAFALVRSTRLVRLLILGEGQDRLELLDLGQLLGVADDVRLPGFVNNPYKYMKRASAFVLSSLFEGFPTVLVEAMACGAPVISSDCTSGPSEILEDGRWGRLVPVGDSVALAKAIQGVLDQTSHPDGRSRALMFHSKRKTREYLKVIGLTA